MVCCKSETQTILSGLHNNSCIFARKHNTAEQIVKREKVICEYIPLQKKDTRNLLVSQATSHNGRHCDSVPHILYFAFQFHLETNTES